MTLVTTANSLAGEKAPSVPFKEDGEHYEYILYHDGDRYISYSDDLDELYNLLIPGYGEMDEEARLDERLKLAIRIQKQFQTNVYLNLSDEERSNLEEWELDAIRGEYDNDEKPYMVTGFWKERLPEGTDPDEVPESERVDVWTSEIPLVIIDAAYAPWSEVPLPLGKQDGSNLLILKPTDELEFLFSLTDTGWITFGEKR